MRDLLQERHLNLRCVAAHVELDREIRWVHVSEIEDPTPWLKGGEFLVTTGIQLRKARLAAYMERLALFGVAGLGFGIGPGAATAYLSAPQELVVAAEANGIPLLEVPFGTPYVAISEFVTSRIAAEQFDVIQRAYDAQRQLTSSILESNGRRRLLGSLAKLTNSWCGVLSLAGELIDSSSELSAPDLTVVDEDIDRARSRGVVSRITEQDGTAWAIHPIGARRIARQLLVVCKSRAFDQFDQTIIAGSVSLLSIDAEYRFGFSQERHRAMSRLGALALRSKASQEDRLDALAALGFDPASRVTVAHVSVPGIDGVQLAEEINGATVERQINYTMAHFDGGSHAVILGVRSEEAEAIIDQAVVSLGAPLHHVGLSEHGFAEHAPVLNWQATVALTHARRRGLTASHFGNMPLHATVAGLIPPERLHELPRVLMAPLNAFSDEDRVKMLADLAAFLRNHGTIALAARERGVHRQTFLKRMTRLAKILDCDLDSMDDRTALWLALEVGTSFKNAVRV
ncbi:MAG TPA: PucR family transcriptional regulator [Terrimesophilobacter sp.]|nr:PucR family transcriptional regulator [Terrimesophilobacter sp.]